MNSNKIGTYVLVGLVIVGLALLLVNLSPILSTLGKITGFFPAIALPATTSVFALGVPEPPILTAWTENINMMGYQNGTVHLNWTASPSIYIYNYILYSTYNYSAGFGGFVNSYQTFPDNETNYSDANAASYNEIYYILRSNTTYGIEDSNNNTWGKFTRTLYSTPLNGKMNLVSTAPVQINKTFADFFIQNITNFTVTQVYKRNSTTGLYSIADYYGGDEIDEWWSRDENFTMIKHGEAYWVKVTKNTSWPVTGNITKENQTVQLYSLSNNGKMNLFGWASVTHGNFADVIKQDLSNFSVIQVYRRNDVTGKYSIADYYGGDEIDEWWSRDENFTGFDPGYGYWIKTLNNVTLTYEPNKV